MRGALRRHSPSYRLPWSPCPPRVSEPRLRSCDPPRVIFRALQKDALLFTITRGGSRGACGFLCVKLTPAAERGVPRGVVPPGVVARGVVARCVVARGVVARGVVARGVPSPRSASASMAARGVFARGVLARGGVAQPGVAARRGVVGRPMASHWLAARGDGGSRAHWLASRGDGGSRGPPALRGVIGRGGVMERGVMAPVGVVALGGVVAPGAAAKRGALAAEGCTARCPAGALLGRLSSGVGGAATVPRPSMPSGHSAVWCALLGDAPPFAMLFTKLPSDIPSQPKWLLTFFESRFGDEAGCAEFSGMYMNQPRGAVRTSERDLILLRGDAP